MVDDPKQPKPMHFNQKRLRKAEFFTPFNNLKAKVGSGGINDEILAKAQTMLENHAIDFLPLADMYLNALMKAIEQAKKANVATIDSDESESLILSMLYPAMQLKANGGMFRYQLVTRVADQLIQFMEVISKPDNDALEIVLAFHTTIRIIVLGRMTNDDGKQGSELITVLEAACKRYFERYPNNRTDIDHDYINKV